MTSSLEQLTTDEAFLEPSTIGELLPKGSRKRYLEWAQTRNKEIEKNRKHNKINDSYDSDNHNDEEDEDEDDNEIGDRVGANSQTHGMHEIIDVDSISDVDSNDDVTTEFMKRNKDRTPTNKKRRALAYILRTVEIFPSKYLVDSDDDEIEKEGTPFTLSATVVPKANGGQQRRAPPTSSTTTTVNHHSKTTGKVKNNRKSAALFQKLSLDAQIVRSIPPEASGIVGVMGRSVNLHQFIDTTSTNNNDDDDDDHDHDDAGLYSMLRAWVHDDPEKTVRSAAVTTDDVADADADSVVVCRKTLLEYSNKDEPASTKATAIAAIAKIAQQQQQQQQQQHPKLLKLEPPPDILGWLATDPLFRSSTPCYPTQKEIRENLQKRRSKKEAKARRKRRLEMARESLRRRGIHV